MSFWFAYLELERRNKIGLKFGKFDRGCEFVIKGKYLLGYKNGVAIKILGDLNKASLHEFA